MSPAFSTTDLALIESAIATAIRAHDTAASRAEVNAFGAACGNCDPEIEDIPAVEFTARAREHRAAAAQLRELLARMAQKEPA